MTITILVGALNPATAILAMGGIFGLCVIYQFTRHKFNFRTFGEHLVSNEDKIQILNQSKEFSITRAPLFILMLLTLAISGNILDGLSEGQVYSFGNVFVFGLLTACSYYGMKNFISSSVLLPTFLIIGGLMLTGLAFKYSPKAVLTGDFMFKLYAGLSALWLIVGLIYKGKKMKTTNA